MANSIYPPPIASPMTPWKNYQTSTTLGRAQIESHLETTNDVLQDPVIIMEPLRFRRPLFDVACPCVDR
jgi:hypothetical protein